MLFQQVARIMLRNDQNPAQHALAQVVESGALVVVIGGQEGARIGAHGAHALQHIHRFRSAIQIDHAQDDVLDVAAEGVAQDDQLHQRQHQRGEDQRRAAPELAHIALHQGQSSLHRVGLPFCRAGRRGGFAHLRQPVAGVMQEYIVQSWWIPPTGSSTRA